MHTKLLQNINEEDVCVKKSHRSSAIAFEEICRKRKRRREEDSKEGSDR
jgi:hypothetical protein